MKNKFYYRSVFPLAFILILVSFVGCGSSIELQSSWKNNEIKIDGDVSDWENNLSIVKDEKVSLGFYNDEESLYICLVTNEKQKIMQMLRAGFIVWFVSEKNGEGVGVKYPMPPQLLDNDERRNFNLDLFQRGDDSNLITKMVETRNEIQIVNMERFPLGQFSLNNNEGIEIKLGHEKDRYSFEMKMPIYSMKDFAYKIDAKPGDKLKIVFETMEFDLSKMRGEKPGGSRRSDNPGAGREGDSQRGMRRGQMDASRFEPINFTTFVVLQKPAK